MRTIVATYLGALLIGISATLTLSAQSGPVNYVYDDLGRLVAVIDGTGASAVYIYDAVGNLTSIARYTSGTVSILEFTPDNGSNGTAVTIYGTGFSTTPSQNAVTFNGVPATVTASSATQIATTVPAGAATGLIAVTTPGGSATSATAFVVGSSAPTITSFTPQIGVAGTSVTINGTNFSPVAANNNVAFNVTYATLSSASTSAITTTVPQKTGSGRIKVATPAGVATGADFFVPPSPYVASDVEFTGRTTPGQPITVSITAANKIGLVLVDGTATHGVAVNVTSEAFTNVSGCDVVVGLRKTDGTALGTDTCLEDGGFIDTRTLPTTGTYTLLVDPGSTATGSIILTPSDVVHATGTITPGGSAVTITTTTPGQNGQLLFSGAANQRVAVLATNETFTAPGCDVLIGLRKFDGTTIGSNICPDGSGFIDVVTLPFGGAYMIAVDPSATATGSVTLTLYNVPGDVTGGITPGGAAVTVTTTAVGQSGVLTFTGTANQRVAVLATDETFTAPGCDVTVAVRKPDGTSLVTPPCISGSGFIDVLTLPVAGTYTIVVDPQETATGSITLTLYDVPADVTGSITAGGSAVTVTTTTPGQNGGLTFTGTANQRVSVLLTNETFAVAGCDVTVGIRKPDGTMLGTSPCIDGSGFIDVRTLPVAGTYTLVIDPQEEATGSITLTLYDVPADVAGSLTIGGGAVGVTITTPGQNGVLTFSGTQSQQVTVRITGNTTGSITVKLLKPDQSQLTSSTSSAASFNLATQTLPTTGTYTVTIDPSQSNTGTLNVSVTSP